MSANDDIMPRHNAVLVLPHIRVQNANAISSPLTWGFPAITAFTGMMTALERRLGRNAGIAMHGVGVICHSFEAQVTSSGYTRAFHLTRNPVQADGSTAGIVEEGRVHIEITLVFDVQLTNANQGRVERAKLAEHVLDTLTTMRVAGGSIVPSLRATTRRFKPPTLDIVRDASQHDERRSQFRALARHWLPGFALVSRDDLLQARLAEMRTDNIGSTVLDAWLDLTRWNSRAIEIPNLNGTDETTVEWITDRRAGWTVPIPVGFAALSALYPPGTVSGSRDNHSPFRFVESVWSIGQWISPNRLTDFDELFWAPRYDHDASQPAEQAVYRCVNAYKQRKP